MGSNADFFGVERPAGFRVTAGSVVNPEVNLGGLPMSFGPLVNRLSVVTAYIAFAFVGAIVLGVF
jgi:hypothetical protein